MAEDPEIILWRDSQRSLEGGERIDEFVGVEGKNGGGWRRPCFRVGNVARASKDPASGKKREPIDAGQETKAAAAVRRRKIAKKKCFVFSTPGWCVSRLTMSAAVSFNILSERILNQRPRSVVHAGSVAAMTLRALLRSKTGFAWPSATNEWQASTSLPHYITVGLTRASCQRWAPRT